MNKGLKIVKLDSNYCDYLRNFDSKVSYNAGSKNLRPFIGVLFNVNNCEYFAPLSSPKEKHKTLKNKLDLIKIDNGNYGVVNLNNMIPVTKFNYVEFDLDKRSNDKKEMARINLLSNQLRLLTANKKDLINKSKLLYKLYKTKQLPKNIENRCCNFILLEEKCNEYNKTKVNS